MFDRWSKKKKEEGKPKKDEPGQASALAADRDAGAPGGPSSSEDGEEVVDTLASLLRTFGEYAFDTPESEGVAASELFDAWARHVLVGSAPPGAEDASASGQEREWADLRRFVSDYRRTESEYVVRSLGDLRETVWFFIQGIGRALPGERASDDAVSEQLSRLSSTIDSNDTSAIRDQARATIDMVQRTIEERFEANSRRNEMLAARVEQFANELLQARQQLELDSLTGLYNRAALDEFLEKMVHLAELSGHVSTLYMIDVDDFKWVNDHFGHQAGDAILKEVALSLRAGFGRRGDFSARYGGDEFSVIVKSEEPEVDEELGERVVHSIRDLEIPHGEEVIRVTLSIGGARLLPGEDVKAWMSRADRALYKAKELGRDRMVLDGGLAEDSDSQAGS